MSHPKPKDECPYCKAKVRTPSKQRHQYPHDTYMLPVTYHCGTSASENWSPPVRGWMCEFGVTLEEIRELLRQHETQNCPQSVAHIRRVMARAERPDKWVIDWIVDSRKE